MNIILRPQTCIQMIGPSHSGKSSASRKIKEYLEFNGRSCIILESDQIRRDLLQLETDERIPNDDSFIISEVAFKKLYSDLDLYTQNPSNIDVVIVDTTGLDGTFRKEISEITRRNGYYNIALIFNLSKETLYSRIGGTQDEINHTRGYIKRQLTRLKEEVLPKFNRSDYKQTYKLSDKSPAIDRMLSFVDDSRMLTLTTGIHAVYGDVHQCIAELKTLHSRVKDKVDRNILIGDYIDKGDEESLKETLQYITNNDFTIIKGNHEEYVYRHLTDPDYIYEENEETQYFTSLKYLLKPENSVYADMFKSLHEKAFDFASIRSNNMWAYISHAPCEKVYLGKRTSKALTKMRNYRFDRESSIVSQLESLLLDGSNIKHIFGHAEIGRDMHVYKTKIAIDQGCVSGGFLTAALVDTSTGRITFEYEKSTRPNAKIEDFSAVIKPWTKTVRLTEDQEKLLGNMIKTNTGFISGTVSPPGSYFEDGVPHFEDVKGAVNLYQNRGITKVFGQKKHMGSRCQLYLFKNLDDSYMVTRKGTYRLRHFKHILETWHTKYSDKFNDVLIVDGELLPWSALGTGLIKQDFTPYYEAFKSELLLLADSSLPVGIKPNIEHERANLEAFKAQLDIYGELISPEQAYFEPFAIIYRDGESYLQAPQDKLMDEFEIHYQMFDLTEENSLEQIRSYNESILLDGRVEGIMLKPNEWKINDIPMLKIRNAEYLRLIYGYNYLDRIESLCRAKEIRGKLSCSIKEQNLNVELLDAYSRDDKKLQKDIYKLLIVEFEKEKGLDPGL